MSRIGKKRGKFAPQNWEYLKDTQHWTRIYDDMLYSKPFLALSKDAKLLYVYLKSLYKGEVYSGNEVTLPYDKITQILQISRRKVRPALEKLVSGGFIVEERGGLYRTPNIYHFSEGWKDASKTPHSCGKYITGSPAEPFKGPKDNPPLI